MKEIIIILIILLVSGFVIYGIIQSPNCIEYSSDGYYAQTKWGHSYFLSTDLEEAKEMYDGLITQEEKCVKWEVK